MLKLGRPCVAMADEAARLLWGKPLDHCLAKGVVRRFMDLGALASAYGIPLEPLEKTIALFNRSVAEGRAPGPGKPAHRTQPLSPPLYAMRVWPKVHHTMGGVQIDARARVVDTRQRPLPGLYAAGEVTGGVHGANRLGGCAVADCVVFGLLAGRHAAEDIPQ
jgi:succinate dehydrogenase/fumarate reductase flavoprotein subunit